MAIESMERGTSQWIVSWIHAANAAGYNVMGRETAHAYGVPLSFFDIQNFIYHR